MSGRVFTIPLHLPFVDALAAGLLAEAGEDPLALARLTVFLPTRRACRSLREAFLRQSPAKALLLPRLRAVGELGEDEGGVGEEGLDLPPAIPALRRRLLLTRLVMQRGLLPGQAASLAAELARFLDEVQGEGRALDRDRLAALAPEEHAAHWQEVLRFLDVLIEHWPRVLAEEGGLDPGARRDRALRALAEGWTREGPADPIIAAGLTGAQPAVAELLAAIARLPNGRVVLPGLDPEVGAFERDDESHPQHAMAHLLQALGVAAPEIETWPTPDAVTGGAPERAILVRQALRPAEATGTWREVAIPAASLASLHRLDCPTSQEEAVAIALLLRHALEEPGRTAAVVTPDRSLARRVAAELRRWGIEIDDSAGVPLARTPPGTFLRLLVEAGRELAPVPLLALLKHPLAGCGMPTARFRALVRRLEIDALRGPRPAPGFAGLRAAIGTDRELAGLVAGLERALGQFVEALAAPQADLAALLRATVAAAERLAATEDEAGPARLWAGEAGEAASRFVAELAEAARDFPAIGAEDWPLLFEALLAGPVVRPRFGRHPRLVLLGLMEARLLQADLVVLAGLNEGTWPADPAVDPWMSRPMRRDFGLASPERRVGEQAHDFAQGLGAREVVLTRASRVDGTPTVPSRWLQRLDAVVEAAGLGRLHAPQHGLLGWAALLDRPASYVPVERPRPRPPAEARPRQLSVTQVETWMRDPYAVFARHVLGLDRLDPLDADPSAAERGQFIHQALEVFVELHPGALPPHAAETLEELGRALLGDRMAQPGVWAFWWPRFRRVAQWFVAVERERRAAIAATVTEASGRLALDGFTLTAKADRLDRRPDGTIVLIDYKTGRPPSPEDVAKGLAPQLTLEAAIAEAGGFRGVPAAPVAALEYWRVSGLRQPGDICPVGGGGAELRALVDEAVAGLRTLVARFADPATPYIPLARLKNGPVWGDYLQLARVKEWMPAVETGE
jgi:ATP-dependent helicase/nuclease subunit B